MGDEKPEQVALFVRSLPQGNEEDFPQTVSDIVR